MLDGLGFLPVEGVRLGVMPNFRYVFSSSDSPGSNQGVLTLIFGIVLDKVGVGILNWTHRHDALYS